MRELWPHQRRAIDLTQEALHAGAKRICLTSPTGGGKTTIATELIKQWRSEGLEVALYTNRRALLEQTMRVLEAAEIAFGVRASGHEPALLRPVQICMSQTEGSQVVNLGKRRLHTAKRVLIDEAHVQKGGTMQALMDGHVEQGGAYIGLTASPLDIGDYYDELIVAGSNSELRQCGALVPCHTYSPDEPDLRTIKNYRIGEDLSEAENKKAIMRPGVFGRIYDSWKKLNPDARPTILFGPDVAGSMFFAEHFYAKGVSAAHIDGEVIWFEGRCFPNTDESRAEIMEGSREGRIKVLCNRFVLREGIDAPWLYHGIFATVFGALTSFLQSGGRLLRAHPSLDHVICQDHGGNWWRHGSLNADREWRLDQTNRSVAEEHKHRVLNKQESEPICCPKCHALRLSGPTCPKCGHSQQRKSRVVVQVDGELREMRGDVYKPRKVSMDSDTQKKWDQCYWRAKRSKRGLTFAQAEGLFFKDNGYWPPRTLANMPRNDMDWNRAVSAVAWEQLIPKPKGDAT